MEKQKNIKRYLGLSVVILLLGGVHVATSETRRRPLTNGERKRFLIAHNSFRHDLTMEFQGTKQPPAANMKRLYWNAALEADALAWTGHETNEQYLHHGHSGVHFLKDYMDMLNVQKSPYVGQNVAVAADNPTRIVREWYADTSLYTLQNNACANKAGCNHFTQIVWAETSYVGCAIAQDEGKELFATCNYYAGGNLKGMPPYKQGENCSLCNTWTKDGFTECEDGLCQPKDKCSPVKECKVVDTVNCLCSEDDYSGIVNKLVKANGRRLAPPSLLLSVVVVVVGLLISPLDIV